MFDTLLVSLFHGIILGGAYGAIALGLSMIFGVSRIINFAHGAMLMIAMFAYYGLYTVLGIDPYIGIIIVVPLMYGFGFVVQKFLLNPLILRERTTVVEPLSILLITIAIGIGLENLFMMLFGADFRTIKTSLTKSYLNIGDGLFVTQWTRFIAFVGSIILAGLLYWLINKTELGMKIRAVSQNRDAAALCGVDVYKTYNISFGIGIAAVSVAAAFLAQFFFIQPQVGAVYGTKSFLIVVLGGLGSIPGALLGGLIFGIVESVGAQFVTSTSASMLTFLLFIIVLMIRPKGLMGKI